jgi:hypothetical protein
MVASSQQQQQRGSSVKENNNGIQQQQRRRRQRNILLWGVVVFALSQLIRKCFKEMGLLPQTGLFETLPSGRKQQQRTSSSTVQDILEGRLTLMDLRVSSSLLQQQPNDDDDVNYVVKATFCEIDWSLQQNNPSTVPMFRDLQSQSKHCPSTKLTVDLWTIVQEARKYDLLQVNNNNGTTVVMAAASQQQPPTGVVFHETRCGSTLVANLLSTMGRTYSESPPPIMALKACGNRRCSNTALHAQLIQDVFYMMGRQPTINKQVNGASSAQSPPPYVFYKIQSIGTFHIDAFVQAMPDVPWVFVYRDTVEILQSHWKPAMLLAGKQRTPVCARGMSSIEQQQQPPTTLQAIQAAGMKLSDLTMVEYCAAHLAGLSLAALQEYQRRTGGGGVGGSSSSASLGRMVHYPQLPNAVWTDLLPDHFGVDPSPRDIARMQDIAEYYSKGRGEEALKAFEKDSVRKQETAPKAVQEAAKVLVDAVYQQLLAATKTTTTTTTS